jgi:hypothetical protein
LENSFVNQNQLSYLDETLDEVDDNRPDRQLRTDLLKAWSNELADIALAPISCVDVYRELVINRATLSLQALDPTVSASAAQLRPLPQGTLSTQHSAEKLALRTRKIDIETGPNSPVERYKLYLVAGFAMTAQANQIHRIPLLLIPVTLHSDAPDDHKIRYEGAALRLNPYIVDVCDGKLDEQFPAFTKATELRDYLRSMNRQLHERLQCRVSANTGLFTLQADVLQNISEDDKFELELARTVPGASFRPLPPAPAGFDALLAAKLTRYIQADDLLDALFDFSSRRHSEPQTAGWRDASLARLDNERQEKVINCARWISELGLGNWSIDALNQLPGRVSNMRMALTSLAGRDEFSRYYRSEEQTAGLLAALYRCDEAIVNSPADLQQHSIGLHADPQTRVLLQSAKVESAVLESEMSALHQTFKITEVPDSEVLSRLIDTIAEREKEPQLTNPLYFKARRRLSDILQTHNGLLTDADLVRLRSLAQTLARIESFTTHIYNKRCFGTLYKGVHSNWQRLDTLIDYARWLAQQLGSESIAGRLLDCWPSYTRDHNSIRGELHQAAHAGWELAALLPNLIGPSTPMPSMIRTAEKFQDKITLWSKYLHRHSPDQTLTPNRLLALADITPEDIADCRLPSREHDQRIIAHIASNGVDFSTLDITANWLLDTMDHLDIDLATVRRHLDAESRLDTTSAVQIAL